MLSAALRALVLLFASAGTIAVHDPAAAREDVAERQLTGTTSAHVGSGSGQDAGGRGLDLLGEPAPVSLAGADKPGGEPCEPCSAGQRRERLPRPPHALRVRDPRRCGAFSPGERPAALAFLRMNGSVNANGAGT